ncbi:MAG: TonB-dependent siderophore receptor [Sphingomonadaceae bacterium]|nr:TonB-dependent siderophore receptor [Sphingomonadaceae bacterium]
MSSTTIRRAVLLAGATCAAWPAIAHAETAEDRDYLPADIIVTGQRDGYSSNDGTSATKTPTPLINVPQSATMLTRDQIDDQGMTQLGEALRYVPGISLDTGEGHRDQVYIRGQSSTADFYLDGLRDDAEYYRPLYATERVEVLKGANALIFGRGGAGGVINRVSKQANPSRFFAQGNASLDTFGAWSLAGDVNTPLSDMAGLRINATYEDFANQRDAYDGRFFGIAPTVTVELGAATRLTASYNYEDDRRVTDRGIPSLGNGPLRGYDRAFFGDPDFNIATVKAHIARTRLEHEFSDGLSVNLTGQYANYDKFYANVVPSGATATTVDLTGYTSGTSRENWIGQGNLVWQTSTGPLHHTLLAGFEFANQQTDADRHNVIFSDGSSRLTVPLARRLGVSGTQVAGISRNSMSQLDMFSAYVQDQIAIGDHFQLIGGLRYDEITLESANLVNGFAARRKDTMWSPRFGVVAKPMESLSFYGSYSRSFLPQSGDQFTVLDSNSATLDPERFENYEIGAKWLVNPGLFFTAAIFRMDRTNTTATDPLNPGFVILTGSSRVEGLEVQLAGAVNEKLQLNLGYTYLDGEIRSDTRSAVAGTPLQQLPTHQASAWARYKLSDAFALGTGVVWQSRQDAALGSNVKLPAYARVDLAAYYDVSDRISLQVNIENLFDRDYYPSAHGANNIQPGTPLSASFGVKVKL